MPPVVPRVWPIIIIASLSGFAGLGYEIIWTRMLANALGHEIIAVLGVISALFAGLALGSLVPGRRIAASTRPALGYAGLEIAIGGWALVLILLFPLAGDLVPTLIPNEDKIRNYRVVVAENCSSARHENSDWITF